MADGNELWRTDGVTLEAIAKEFGVSRERVRQIEFAALRKCRRWCERNGYRLEDIIRFDERLPGD
jgi:DNA-directed RNA polymerase sigma subunit (sigma70/sigma32)